jgi:hypothetical protein
MYQVFQSCINFRGRDEDNDIQWDGIEVRLINLLSRVFNFTTDYREAPRWDSLGLVQFTRMFNQNLIV